MTNFFPTLLVSYPSKRQKISNIASKKYMMEIDSLFLRVLTSHIDIKTSKIWLYT